MARPRGMRKVDGIWIMPDGSVAPSSAAKAGNNITPGVAPAKVIIAPQNGTQSVTDALPQQRRTGTKVHTGKEIRDTEIKTGLVMIGNFSDNVGILVPVFVNPNRNEDWRNEHLTRIRKGM